MLREELKVLLEYAEAIDEMTWEEKDGLCEWMAHGNSANSNPFLVYGENGCLLDFVAASRFVEALAAEYGSCP
jgi:hypothetical protein